jgi:hypothetical protein
MKIETKHVIQWTVTVIIGVIGIWAALKNKAASDGAPSNVTNSSPFSLGAPSISIIGGSDPSTWNIAATQPTAGNVGASTTPINMPIISNYGNTSNSGCNTCANAPNLYWASAIEANAAITAAMLKLNGFTKVNGQIVPGGYYDLSGDYGNATGIASV